MAWNKTIERSIVCEKASQCVSRRCDRPRLPPHPPPCCRHLLSSKHCHRRLLSPKHCRHRLSPCLPQVVAVPVPSPSLAHGEVDLAAHRASPLSPSAPLLPSTLGVIAGSGPCSARSTAPTSVHHGALPLRRRVGQATPEPISAAGWALPLLLVTPLLPSLLNTITKSGSCGAGSVVPPWSLPPHRSSPGSALVPPPPRPVVARSGLNASGPDPCMPGRCGLHR
jgi:hypothetical protein